MVHYEDATTVHDAALDLEAAGRLITVPRLAGALTRLGSDYGDTELRDAVATANGVRLRTVVRGTSAAELKQRRR